ncbi:hypothetical protein [Clostridium sp.]|uniref:hypothetical protein n=1 Tax=Clostridium sp. TaxID=1506 RepID=UPI002616C815|nr:hypothetical protein [Clostridium sp.]
MSKLNIRLSYKNACILKHALRDKVENNQTCVDLVNKLIEENDSKILDEKAWEKQKKELEEEKRALAVITEEIERCGFRHNRQIFK